MATAGEDDVLERALRQVVRGVLEAPDVPALVLCPHAVLADQFLKSLQAHLPARSLPRVTTLSGWAAQQPVSGRIVPEIERLSLVFNALREQRWFEHQDHWALAREALQLVDELTRWGFVMPPDPQAFAQALSQVHALRQESLLLLEARLVHELWWVLHQDPLELSPPMAYQQQLAQLASGAADQHVYLVAPGVWTPAEAACLEALGKQRPLVCIAQEAPGCANAPVTPVLRAAWQEPLQETLESRAMRLRKDFPESPLAARLTMTGVSSIEQEAALGLAQIQAWRAEKRQGIAVVAQDRVSARRLSALLLRHGIPVCDESGWTFSTTAASAVVMRWLEWIRTGGHYRALEDVLHSPYLCADWPESRRDQAVAVLEAFLLQINWVSGLEGLEQRFAARADAAQPGWDDAGTLLGRLLQSARPFLGPARTFAEWLAHLVRALEVCGITPGLQLDAAGLQLLALLARLDGDTRRVPGRLSLSEWTRVLELQFESASFQEEGTGDAVVLTQLSMTRLRSFEAVWVVGADAEHLPYLPPPVYFGDAVRRALGLPVRQQLLDACREDLTELVSRADTVRIVWRSDREGESNPLAPLLQRLDLLHMKTWGQSLIGSGVAQDPPLPSLSPPMPPAPVVPPSRVPHTMTASGYNRLLTCPYQYFVADILALRPMPDMQETVGKRDYGELVHAILYRFHRDVPRVSALSREEAVARLGSATRAAFENHAVPDGELRAWRLRWESRMGEYVEWVVAHEQEGWRWQEGESSREQLLGAHTPGHVRLKGKLDRCDQRDEGTGPTLAILDYKLKKYHGGIPRALREGEDIQLAVYALLAQGEVTQASYLLLEETPFRQVSLPDPAASAERAGARLVSLMAALRNGAALPAQGVSDDCAQCAFDGLCRRGYWEDGP